jgi:hypothetical protein
MTETEPRLIAAPATIRLEKITWGGGKCSGSSRTYPPCYLFPILFILPIHVNRFPLRNSTPSAFNFPIPIPQSQPISVYLRGLAVLFPFPTPHFNHINYRFSSLFLCPQ